jgi:hypothetical protein
MIRFAITGPTPGRDPRSASVAVFTLIGRPIGLASASHRAFGRPLSAGGPSRRQRPKRGAGVVSGQRSAGRPRP